MRFTPRIAFNKRIDCPNTASMLLFGTSRLEENLKNQARNQKPNDLLAFLLGSSKRVGSIANFLHES